MDDKRQQIQLKLAFMEEGRGGALRAFREGTEASMAVARTRKSGDWRVFDGGGLRA